jgi:hypothetical protein
MLERVKVKLRDQDLDIFEYGGQYPPPFLYFKSRYINEEFPGFPEQQEFRPAARGAGTLDGQRLRSRPAEFLAWLQHQRREIARNAFGSLRLVSRPSTSRVASTTRSVS